MARTVWEADNWPAYSNALRAFLEREATMWEFKGVYTDGPFSTEDSLHLFVEGLSPHERNALYEMLYNTGCRYRGDAIKIWRDSKRGK